MLKKLLKYDFKSVLRYWWIAALSSVVLAFAGGWSISVFTNEKELPTVVYVLAILVAIIAVLGLCAFSILTVVFVYSRFYKNFFTDEGYLTFTLPVKRSQLLNSKIITSVVASYMTGFVIMADIVIAIFIGAHDVFDKMFFKDLWEEFVVEVIEGAGFYFVVYLAELLLLFLLVGVLSTLFVFCCITVGSLIAKKGKIITSIAIYYVANSAFTFMIQIFWLFGIDAIDSWTTQLTEDQFAPILALLLLVGILFVAAVGAVLYSLQYWMLDRKLNLA